MISLQEYIQHKGGFESEDRTDKTLLERLQMDTVPLTSSILGFSQYVG